MRNAIIAAIVSAVVASAGAGAYTAPTRSELALRVSVLEEHVATLELTVQADRANLTRYIKRLRKCVQLEEELENACTSEAVREARLP